MQRCPECWSTVETGLASCPHCGHVLSRRRPSPSRWLVPAGIVLFGAGAWYLYGYTSKRPTAPTNSTQAELQPTDSTSSDEPEIARGEEQAPVVHWQLKDGDRPVPVLLLTSQAGPAGFIPMGALPLDGPLDANGVELETQVIHYDSLRGYALLRLPPLPVGATTLPSRDSTAAGKELSARTLDLAVINDIHIASRTLEGLLVLDRDVPAASAILDATGYAIAYALGGNLALPLDAARAWLDYAQTRTLQAVQEEIRSQDPVRLVRDAAALMQRPLEVHKVRAAIALLQRGINLARGHELIDRYDELQRLAWQNLVRLLAPVDSATAITEARKGLILFPDHVGLLADTVHLMARDGDPLEAADRYIQLAALSPDHAQQCADILTNALARRGRKLVEGTRIAEGLTYYARAVALFPNRADLHLAYASALLRAGDQGLALAHAERAAALDPSFQDRVARFRRTDTGGRRTEIPFDPRTNVINANVTVGGIPLSLVVDTGATMTTIPTALADQLNLRSPENRRVTVTTASGRVEGEVVRLPLMKIGQLFLKNVEAVVIDLPKPMHAKGLLGMNALSQTRVEIDSERGRLILHRKRRRH